MVTRTSKGVVLMNEKDGIQQTYTNGIAKGRIVPNEKEIKGCEFKFKQPHFKNGQECCALTEDLCSDIKFICDENCRIYELQQQLETALADNEKLKEENRCQHYVLGECSQGHHNNCFGMQQCILDLERQVSELANDRNVYKKLTEDWQKITEELQNDSLHNVAPINFNKTVKQLLSEKQVLVEGLSEIANSVCETGCRYDDNDCTPDNCIIRHFKDVAKQTLEKIGG